MTRPILFFLCVVMGSSIAAQVVQFNIQHAICGATTGTIWPQVTGGTPPYSYSWSNGATTTNLIDVPAGAYTLTITDASSNTVMGSAEILVLDVLFPQFELTAYSCLDDCGGNLYHYLPFTGGFTYTVTLDPPMGTGMATPNGLSLSGLCVGTEYTATITRSDGCEGFVGPITVEGPIQPELLSTTVTGSCPGGATGSVSLLFDQLSFINISGPGIIDTLTEVSNPYTLNNLAPGEYMGIALGDYMAFPGGTSCALSFSFEIPETTDPCGQLSGTAFADLDGDCMQDADEVGVPYKIFSVEPGDHLFITDGSGNFSTEFPYGTYDLNTTFTDYTSDCVVLPYAFTLDAGNMSETVVLPLAPQFGPDVSVFLSAGNHVPGFAVNYHVSLSNQGPFNFSGMTLDLMFDPLLLLGAVEGSPVLVAPGHYQWTGLDLTAFGSIQFEVSFTVPPDANLLGTAVTGTASVTGNAGDEDPSNDTYTITRTIVGAYDPNDKLVQTSSQASETQYFLDQDSYVDYTIRFQNTGTAPAINVYLLDTISVDLNLLSLQILGSSHSFTPSIQPDRVLRFDFPGIMLPDSSADLAGSQGFISFRLKPVDDLPIGTYLVNAADIFFDFNEPIRTNDAELVIDMSTGVRSLQFDQIRVFPNPTHDLLQVRLPEGNWTLEVLSMDGRIQMRHRSAGNLATLAVDQLAAGQYILRATAGDGTVSVGRFTRH